MDRWQPGTAEIFGVIDRTGLKSSAFLQPPLNRFFIPRPPMIYKPATDRVFSKRNGPVFGGVAAFMSRIGEKKVGVQSRTKEEEQSKPEDSKQKLAIERERWRTGLSQLKGDPFKTIFVGRLAYDTSERQLWKEFEVYGGVRNVVVIKGRGYAFIEFEREKSVREAFLDADGRKIIQRRCVVDVERGRTVKGWIPRRLGGGLGKTRVGPPEDCQKVSGRDPEASKKERPVLREDKYREKDSERRHHKSPDRSVSKHSRSPERYRPRQSRSPVRRDHTQVAYRHSYRDYDRPDRTDY